MAIHFNTLEKLHNLKNKVKNLDIIFIGDHAPAFDEIPNHLLKKLNINTTLKKNHKHKTENLIKIIKDMGYRNIFF